MQNRMPPNRLRMLDTMEDIRQNCKGRIYANMFTVKEFAELLKSVSILFTNYGKTKDFP